jgi:gamma-glutamyltranspeptidase/glutathione hydrolase
MVADDRNAKGYESICIPGSVEGLALALENFGRKSLAKVIEPAAQLAKHGLPVDWHSSLNVSLCAAQLREFGGSRAVYMPNDLPPAPHQGRELLATECASPAPIDGCRRRGRGISTRAS